MFYAASFDRHDWIAYPCAACILGFIFGLLATASHLDYLDMSERYNAWHLFLLGAFSQQEFL
jgi:hypothetical protein